MLQDWAQLNRVAGTWSANPSNKRQVTSFKLQASSVKLRAIRSNKLQASSVERSVYKVCLYMGPVVHGDRFAYQLSLTVERGALIKFYGSRSEGLDQDKIPNCSGCMKHDLMG